MTTIVNVCEMWYDKPNVYLRFDSDEYHIWADDGHVKLFYKDVLKYEWVAESEMDCIDITISSPKKHYRYNQFYNDGTEDDSWGHAINGWDYSEFIDDWNTEYIEFQYESTIIRENAYYNRLMPQEC